MRPIKFRVWDNLLGRFRYYNSIFNGRPIYDLTHWANICEPEQFTGLLDCEGKEIYEGDIVGPIFINGDEYDWSEIIFENGCFTIKIIGGLGQNRNYSPCLYEADERFIKIVGNIHEDKS